MSQIKVEKKISVIIPVYNAEKFLRQTLHCICCQTYKNLEIVCVLDCPSDKSAEIVEEFAQHDSRIVILRLEKNMGQAAARNKGVQNSIGEYIHFMDSDDLIIPDFYETMINAATKADADISACSVFYEKRPLRSIWFKKDEVLSDSAEKIEKTEVLIQGWIWRYLIKKSFWEHHSFLFPNLAVQEDTAVVIPMIYYANKVVLCPNAVYFYKNRENSILNKKERSTEQEKKWKENRQKVRKIKLDFIKKHNIKRPNKWLYYIKKYFV